VLNPVGVKLVGAEEEKTNKRSKSHTSLVGVNKNSVRISAKKGRMFANVFYLIKFGVMYYLICANLGASSVAN